jgi:hypothetical protein
MLENIETWDIEEISKKLVGTLDTIRELREQQDQLQKELANRLVDREPDIGSTYIVDGYRWKLSRPNKKEQWDLDNLKRDLYRDAITGRFHADPLGELHGEPETRLYDVFTRVFTLTPKKTPLKDYGIDPKEYCETLEPGDLKATLQKE